jgi:solute carrier family 30 (zinc transporter), member 9
VLGLSFLIEGSVLLYAVRGVVAQSRELGFLRYLREKADPATLAILLEDGAAVFGLLLAAGGILLTYATGNAMWDALASLVIGLLLGLIALYLVLENRTLLLGRAVPVELERRFVEIVRARPSIADIHDVKTRQLTPEVFQVKAEVRFSEGFVAARLSNALPEGAPLPQGELRQSLLLDVGRQLIQSLSEEIDAIEAEVRSAIPQARHIDLELEHLPGGAPEDAASRPRQARP